MGELVEDAWNDQRSSSQFSQTRSGRTSSALLDGLFAFSRSCSGGSITSGGSGLGSGQWREGCVLRVPRSCVSYLQDFLP